MKVHGLNLHMSRRQNLASILILLFIFGSEVIGIYFHQQIKNQLNAWKLLPQPELLTELYFTNPNSLPTSYVPGQSQTIRFTVHNLEYKTEVYQYKITEVNQTSSKNQLLDSGEFTLQQNGSKNIVQAVIPANFGSRTKLIIELPTVDEQINYWVNRSNQ